MTTALQILEETYDMAINPNLDYGAQLEPLAHNGELANRVSTNKVLFKLCMLIDAQAKEIQALKDVRVASATKEMEGKKDAAITQQPKLDPEKPLQPKS